MSHNKPPKTWAERLSQEQAKQKELLAKSEPTADVQNTQDEIDDMNEAIAIFDGWELVHDHEIIVNEQVVKTDCFIKENQHPKYHFDLKYHSSWDALMPVVQKIKDHKQSLIRLPFNETPESVIPYLEAIRPMNMALIKADLKGVYNGAYNFTQWYNQQKQNDDN